MKIKLLLTTICSLIFSTAVFSAPSLNGTLIIAENEILIDVEVPTVTNTRSSLSTSEIATNASKAIVKTGNVSGVKALIVEEEITPNIVENISNGDDDDGKKEEVEKEEVINDDIPDAEEEINPSK